MASAITMFSHLKIPLEEIVKATNNFAVENIIGEGGFGNAYKGKLMHSGELINIVARRLDHKYWQGGIEFWTEISVLSSLKHENLVSLIGFCDENGEKVIINTRETKGSLFMYLGDPTLTWSQRLNICVGIARALRYIHDGEGRGYIVIHRNINSSTILLDDNWEPKLSGFEFSIKQSVDRVNRDVLSEAIGTRGYMDPSIEKMGGVTHKSDIYSFGVVLCEMLCGRKAFIPDVDDRLLAPLFIFHYENGSLNDIIHPDLWSQMTRRSLTRFSKAAYSCLKEDRTQRPNMTDIVIELEKAFELQWPLENLRRNLEHLKIPLGDIMLATDNFSNAYHTGNIVVYDLYRAELNHFDEENPSTKEGCRTCNTVFIKRFHQREDELGEELFFTEIEMLTTCKHPNVVKLLGVCHEGSEMILVIEHLSNGYLADYWINANDMPILTWATRLKICLDVANALNYLHTEMEDQKMIIHRDIKSRHILLDENWGAKIIDFGVSVFLPPNQDDNALYQNIIVGAQDYMDPEYLETGKLKRESDVYSFGVVLLEVLCGRLAYDTIYLKESDKRMAFLARQCFREGTIMEMIDPVLKEESDENNFSLNRGTNKDSLKKFVKIAQDCIAEMQDQRPTMKVVIKELREALFFQEGQLQPLHMVQIADEVEESMELKLTHENYEDKTEHPNVEVINEVKNSKELKLNNTNSIKKLEHLKIPFGDIMLATNNFSDVYIIRNTAYYALYIAELEHFDKENALIEEGTNEGELPRRRSTVVIKRIHPSEDEIGEEMFYTEIEMLTTCKHPNIVQLLGICDEGSEMILVIEHLSNEYLSDYWLDKTNTRRRILTWVKRLKICLDVANALNYLHNEMEDQKRVIQRDFKSLHIMLDENWRAKIADFGFSVFLPPNQDDDALYHDIVTGTKFYRDPEYWVTTKLKRESDVYSFGVILFEVLCGKLACDPIYLKESDDLGQAFVARRCFREGTIMEMIDPILMEGSGKNNFNLNRTPNKDSLEKFIKIAHDCIAETQDQRPTMKVVIKELQEALFFQEEQLQPLHMVDVADEVGESMELKLTHENYENKTERSNMEVINEVKKSKELKLKNENSIKKLEHLKIHLSDIMLATENFSDAYGIRSTAFYALYIAELEHFDKENPLIKEGTNEGELPRRRSTVVIKRILPSEDEIGEEMFYTEIEMLTTCKHPNIVQLLGICDEGSEMILVIEHLSNEYLSDYWLDKTNTMRHILTWIKRLKICLDVANALNYLHNEMEDQQRVIQRDFKSLYIVLDENQGAKIADFGFSVFLPPNQDDDALYYDIVTGTKIYRDPEYWVTGKLKRESDVYSFGVILFEVLCGKLASDPVYLKESDDLGQAFVARRCFREGTIMEMIDPILKEGSGENNFSLNRGPNKNSLEKFIKIAHDCIAETQDQRPTMKVVIKELQEALFFQENNKDDFIISLDDIKLATKNFHGDNCIGKGGFGKVYKGEVPEGDGFNTIVAKRLDTQFGQGEQQFRNELQILFEYKHEKLIRLVGYCDEKNEQIIVYEYASQGSLNRYLKDARLTWMKRLKICIDVATALAFLHGGSGKQAIVIHRDIKTENILLNDKWDAKLADFGLSLISPINKKTDYVIDYACGTKGYLDPLYLKSGFLTIESDIYSFGVVLFEIMCGRSTFEIRKHKGKYLPGFIKESFEKRKHDDLVFEALKEQIVPKALTAFQTIAYQCLHDDREKRPTAKEVLEQLNKALEFQILKERD